MNRKSIVKDAWKKLGFQIRPLKNRIIIRTEPIAKKVGKDEIIWLPPKLQYFYGELGNLQLVTATVLAVGNKVKENLKPGDHIAFARLFFARLYDIDVPGQDHVGYILEENVIGWVDMTKRLMED